MSAECLFQDPLGEVDHIADLMICTEGLGPRSDFAKDGIVYRYRSQRVRRQAIRALEQFIADHEERQAPHLRFANETRTVPARLPQKDFDALNAIIDLLRNFQHDNGAV
jgi:hypothetical protein